MGETQMAIYRTALDAERKMHEECNADLNRALDTITSRNTKIAQLEERVAELEEKLDNLHASWRDGSIGIHMDMGDIEKRVDEIDLLVTALVVVYGERFIGLDSDG